MQIFLISESWTSISFEWSTTSQSNTRQANRLRNIRRRRVSQIRIWSPALRWLRMGVCQQRWNSHWSDCHWKNCREWAALYGKMFMGGHTNTGENPSKPRLPLHSIQWWRDSSRRIRSISFEIVPRYYYYYNSCLRCTTKKNILLMWGLMKMSWHQLTDIILCTDYFLS